MQDHRPARCPLGHPLVPGRMLVGWEPCVCPAAVENHGGHRTVQCLDCLDRRITSICRQPPHLRTPESIGQEAAWMRAALDRARRTAATGLTPEIREAAERKAAGLEASIRAKEISAAWAARAEG